MDAFLPVGILFILAIIISTGLFTVKRLLGPRNPVPAKLAVYECGVTPESSARIPFQTGFYLIAVLFLLFDVEAAFFFPWALVYKESLAEGPALLIAMLIYMALLVLGLVYIFRKDCLKLN
ncbi:MAG: NADH-quinone oxidoreductase subunit A [Deltaproteobacteria bacterium]|nr:NADH-quinone oxidoreductase subunit A [Deltaproteobacteria bacterium]